MKRIISQGNWSFLHAEAVTHRPLPSEALSCAANHSRVTWGDYNVVFELCFSDGTFWVARIRICDGDEDFDTEMLSEIATVRLVSEKTSIPVPKLFTYDCKARNPFGFPYMLTSTLPGKILKDQFAFSVPSTFHPKIGSQLAKYVWELSRITFHETGRIWYGRYLDEEAQITPFPVIDEDIGPFNSSRAYFYGVRRDINQAVCGEHCDDWAEWLISCEVLIETIPSMLCPTLRCGPYPLYHRDFHFKNMPAYDDFNINGVLDWTEARTMPWERFTVYAGFMPWTGFSDEENKPIINLRNAFVDAFRRLEPAGSSRISPRISDIFDSTLPELIHLWDQGIPDDAQSALRCASSVLNRLFGDGVTLKNYRDRRRKLASYICHFAKEYHVASIT